MPRSSGAKVGQDNNMHNERKKRSSDNSEGDADSGNEAEGDQGPPSKFVIPGDDTGIGIDYHILDQESWQTLQEYCQNWGVKQAHLESIYARFARTIIRTEHLDFTSKPQFHVSLDFLADEFMTTAGEFAAQFFIQTWFLRRKRGLHSPKDRRCVDFARLVIMSCDLARLGDFELLSNFWACVLHRFGRLYPSGVANLNTQLNTELIQEVIKVLHARPDKKRNILINMLFDKAEELVPETEDTGVPREDQEGAGEEAVGEEGNAGQQQGRPRRYLAVWSVLRFCYEHPPLLFPVVQFQRILRSKIIGSRYWLRRRKPSSERGVDLPSALGLPEAYSDVFDRVEGRREAWIVASGNILIHALDHSRGVSPSILTGNRTGGEDGADTERHRRFLDNCLPPAWYTASKGNRSAEVLLSSRTPSPERTGAKITQGLASKTNRLRLASKGLGSRVRKARLKTAVDAAATVDKTASSMSHVVPEDQETFEGSPQMEFRQRRSIGVRDARDSHPTRADTLRRENDTGGSATASEPPSRFLKHTGDLECNNKRGLGSGHDLHVPISGAPLSLVNDRMDDQAVEEQWDRQQRQQQQPGNMVGTMSNSPVPSVPNEGGARSALSIPGEGRGSTGVGVVTPLLWPVGQDRMSVSKADSLTSRSGGSKAGRTARRVRASPFMTADGDDAGGKTERNAAIDNTYSKLCPLCLRSFSHFAICGKCGRRAAKALKDRQGSRRAKLILVPYGSHFGVGAADALDGEGDAVKRWVRMYDDDSGACFFYNVYYDSAVWKDEIELPKPGNSPRSRRRRKLAGGGGGLHPAVKPTATSPTPTVTPPRILSPKNARVGRDLLTTTMGEAAAVLFGRTRPDAKATLSPSQGRPASGDGFPTRAVLVLAAGEEIDGAVPEVVLDAHKKMYPPFRLVMPKEKDLLSAGGPDGGAPTEDDGRSRSRGRAETGDTR